MSTFASTPEKARRRAQRGRTAAAGPLDGEGPPIRRAAARRRDAAIPVQALTDVDLFSSYGLTQKAMDLLETVLQRVPESAPTLERLLDLHLGAGDDRRTAELAAQLEQLHRTR